MLKYEQDNVSNGLVHTIKFIKDMFMIDNNKSNDPGLRSIKFFVETLVECGVLIKTDYEFIITENINLININDITKMVKNNIDINVILRKNKLKQLMKNVNI